jgi:catechol 2,3-dioxygenase-like lactoylglutathione lyase family enzyme
VLTGCGDGYVVQVLIADIHHVSLNVTDTERSLGLYRDTLGLAMLPRPDFSFKGAWLDAGNGRQVHLIESQHVAPNLGQHISFRVTDLESVVISLRDAGVEVSASKSVGDTSIRQAFMLDPDGNLIEFTQP